MTRKDYVAVAAILADLKDYNDTQARAVLKAIAYRLAVLFKADNPAFDSARFTKACGVDK